MWAEKGMLWSGMAGGRPGLKGALCTLGEGSWDPLPWSHSAPSQLLLSCVVEMGQQ